eukprot:c16155_g1_i1.p1 GENE.c16155_g1_i1~~c16155_g1_i1.p1  ORF type:complete len:253 (+),score=62.50 c16155_g1_i1:270-1028(+)
MILCVPLSVGRGLTHLVGIPLPHDLDTYALGFAACLGGHFAFKRLLLVSRTQNVFEVACASVRFGIVWGVALTVLPLLLGAIVDAAVVTVATVLPHQTPYVGPLPTWVCGVFYFKLTSRLALAFRHPAVTRWQQNANQMLSFNLGNKSLVWIIHNVLVPPICCLSLTLAVPVLLCKGLLALWLSPFTCEHIYRYFYLLGFFVWMSIKSVVMIRGAVSTLHKHILDEKYLVSQRLHNREEPDQMAPAQELPQQ